MNDCAFLFFRACSALAILAVLSSPARAGAEEVTPPDSQVKTVVDRLLSA